MVPYKSTIHMKIQSFALWKANFMSSFSFSFLMKAKFMSGSWKVTKNYITLVQIYNIITKNHFQVANANTLFLHTTLQTFLYLGEN